MIGHTCLTDGGRERWRPGRLLAQWKTGLFVIYLAFILEITLLARSEVTDPMKSVWLHMWFRDDVKWNNEIIENILLFIPYTALFLVAFRLRRPFWKALALAVCSTALIELMQLVCRLGEFQVSDLMYNTLGGILGCGLWAPFSILFPGNRLPTRSA